MRIFLSLIVVSLLCSCANREAANGPGDTVPFDQKLTQFAALHNSGQPDALRTYFTKDATIQSPATPRTAGVDQFLSALAADPYTIGFAGTETIYSTPGRAVTRSAGTVSAAGRYQLKENVTIDWRLEDGYWRIARLRFTEWPSVIGTWRKAGINREGSIELRVLPGGTYTVFLAEDYSSPAFHGRYRLEGNKITFADSGANDPRDFQKAEGSYLFVRSGQGGTFRRVTDENTWRTERFDGDWSAH